MTTDHTIDSSARVAPDVRMGRDVRIHAFANLYGCRLGDEVRVGTFVEIQKGVLVGNRCKISSHSFLCEGVELGDEVFIGHHVVFTNDRFPRATNDRGDLQGEADWTCEPTRVERRAAIGSGSVLLPGIVVGEEATVGAGSVVTRSVEPRTTVVGNPARILPTRRASDE